MSVSYQMTILYKILPFDQCKVVYVDLKDHPEGVTVVVMVNKQLVVFWWSYSIKVKTYED